MNLSDQLNRLLPADVMSLLRRAGCLAAETGASVYLVGGIVRDILLKRPNLDIDLVVEGNGPAFAAALAAAFEGTVVIHDRFGTSVVILPGKRRVDVATARKETYSQGGVLPDVIGALLQDDLGRRDFTINAMAVSLNPDDYGELIDYYDGREDMARKRIRVLHHASFVDDPTRVFRAVRFEKRFGFAMTKETETLLRNAVADDLLKTVSGTRIRNEVMAVFGEEDAAAVVARLQEFGVWNALSSGVRADNTALKLFREIVKAEPELRPGLTPLYKRGYAFLKALLAAADKTASASFLGLINIDNTKTKEILAAVAWAPEAAKRLAVDGLRASELWEELSGKTDETIVFVYALSGREARANIKRFLDIRKTKTLINGNDLIAMGFKPSEKFAAVLREVLKAQLDARVSTPEDECAMAARLLEEA